MRAFPGRKDLREGRDERNKSVTRDRKECRVQEETEGAKGLLGRANSGIQGTKGEPGPLGMKGERDIVGNQGRKGDKGYEGEKGESAKASQTSVVPQTNWKQCVWKSDSGTDNGKIKVHVIIIVIFLDFHFTKHGLP